MTVTPCARNWLIVVSSPGASVITPAVSDRRTTW
jgi:hypothetical protein